MTAVRRLAALTITLSVATAACSSGGDSILDSGERPTTTVASPDPTSDDTADSTVDQTSVGGETTGSDTGDPTTTAPAPTTTTLPLDTLPSCPTDALPTDGEPIEVLFWHGLNIDNEDALVRVTDEYNASQDRVRVRLEKQGSYKETIDKYFQSGQDSRPDMVMLPDYSTQRIIDSGSVIPVDACLRDSGFDTSAFQPSTLAAYTTVGVQWGMPFNVSNPVLYYNRTMFTEAGLDPDRPPQNLDELRQYSQQIVDSGAAAYGVALDSGPDSGGGWFIEQWFANVGELYSDNGNGRLARSTQVLYDGPMGVELLSYVQALITDGLAYNVGDNAGGGDQLLKLADQQAPAAMTIATSAVLGSVLNAVNQGLIPGITADQVGVGPFPGPGPTPTALVGGAALYVVADHGDERTAAVWDFVEYLVSSEVQSLWATLTGYVPVRSDALEVEPAVSVYAADPRFRVAYDQLISTPDDVASQGPILGPMREIRAVNARAVAGIFGGEDVQTALSAAAEQANGLLADYDARN